MSELPFVSVVMPVRNESAFIRRSLSAVFAQDYARERMEILVVDGLSSDGTPDIVRELGLQHDNLRLINNTGKIAPTGLNVGLAEARGDIIIRVDGHCEIAPDYVSRCVEHLSADDIDAVGGPIETVGETPTARIIALAMSSPFGVGGSSFRTVNDRSMLVDTVAFPGYSRRAIEKAGWFDEELVRNQDDEYNYRLRKLGGRLLLSPDVRSRYYSRGSLRSLWRQYFQYGYWKVRVMQKHHRQMRLYQLVPAAFVAVSLLALMLSPFYGVALSVLLLLASAYIAANTVASVKAVPADHWRGLPLLMLCFWILHFSYGCGFLYGLVSFRNNWGNNESNAPPMEPRASGKQA